MISCTRCGNLNDEHGLCPDCADELTRCPICGEPLAGEGVRYGRDYVHGECLAAAMDEADAIRRSDHFDYERARGAL